MKFLASVDERLILMVQEVYLWLWDRTGVFVGALTAVLALIALALTASSILLAVLAGAIFSIHGILLIFIQGAGLGRFNAEARRWRYSVLRSLLIAVDLACLLQEAWGGHLPHVISYLLIVTAFLYLPCIQIRDREPPEKFNFASEGA